jgi:hypothetical protein
MLFLEMNQSVYRVIGFWKMEFYVGCLDFVAVVDSCSHHVISIEFVKQTLAWLKGILWRNHKPDLLQIRRLRHNIGNDQMPHMYWIKRPEEETDFQIDVSYFCHKDTKGRKVSQRLYPNDVKLKDKSSYTFFHHRNMKIQKIA